MSSKFQDLMEKGLLKSPPQYLKNNVQYEVITGSTAYGVAQDDSDRDVIGFAIPSKEILFPHTVGFIEGFNKPTNKFEQFQQHHIMDQSARAGEGIEYDISMYSIVKFFRLCMENNPNMADTLFVPENCVLHCTDVGRMVKDARRDFLHKGSYHKFRGYAMSQKNKMQSKNIRKVLDLEEKFGLSDEEAHYLYDIYTRGNYIDVRDYLWGQKGWNNEDSVQYSNALKSCGQITKRRDSIKKFGFDVKFAYHIVRLMEECDQILNTGDLNLQRDADLLKAIRRGEWSEERILSYFETKEKQLELDYASSTLRYGADESLIRTLLMSCLEHHYGNLEDCVAELGKSERVLNEMIALLHKNSLV